jgi:rhodanese-related sulfurtransferase
MDVPRNLKSTVLPRLLSAMVLCGFLFLTLPAADLVPFTDLTPAQAAELIKAKSTDPLFIILDVRTAEEFAVNRIEKAQNIDVKALDFNEKIAKLDTNGTYLVYCRSGVRSVRAMNLMKEAGFKTVYNLAGGIKKWQEEKLPLEGTPFQTEPPKS